MFYYYCICNKYGDVDIKRYIDKLIFPYSANITCLVIGEAYFTVCY